MFKMALPLEQAIREAYTEKNLEFPKRTIISETVLHRTNEFTASYSTRRFPPGSEVLIIGRPVRKGRMELYIRLDDTVQIEFKKIYTPGIPVQEDDQEADQMSAVFMYAKHDLKMMEKYNAKKASPDMLKDLARDFLAVLEYAKEIIKPVEG